MKKKLLIFDIDGTLCDINKKVNDKLALTLKNISKNHQIVLSSGKPASYICGFIRQLGLKNCIVIGENGGVVMYSSTFPPKDFYKVEILDEVKQEFETIKKEYIKKFKKSIWIQPNEVNLTIFPINILNIKHIHDFSQQFNNSKIKIYLHKDSVDFVQKGFDKSTAVDVLLEKLNYKNKELYVFGDGVNDYTMLKKTNNSFLIGKNRNIIVKNRLEDYEELRIFLDNKFIKK